MLETDNVYIVAQSEVEFVANFGEDPFMYNIVCFITIFLPLKELGCY